MFLSQKRWPKGGDALDFFRDSSYLIHQRSSIKARTHRPGRPFDYQKKQSTTCSSRNIGASDLNLTWELLNNILEDKINSECITVSIPSNISKLSQRGINFQKADSRPTLHRIDSEQSQMNAIFFNHVWWAWLAVKTV